MDQYARLESGILSVKTRPWILITVEEPDWDLLTPLQSCIHRGVEVVWVVLGIFQSVHPFAEPLIGVVLVERHARAKDINQSKAGVLDRVGVQFQQVLGLAAESASNITAAARE